MRSGRYCSNPRNSCKVRAEGEGRSVLGLYCSLCFVLERRLFPMSFSGMYSPLSCGSHCDIRVEYNSASSLYHITEVCMGTSLMDHAILCLQGGYDYTIGTSEHGQKIRAAELTLPKFK